MYRTYFKRILDIVFSFTILLGLSGFLILITLVLYFVNDGKPFFVQKRPGKDEIIFKIIKFKTMNDKVDSTGKLLPDNQRLTKFGKIVRQTSLDEVPQLFNVLKGDMSIIGPRPLLVEYLPYYTDTERTRHSIRPGITGLAQIKGRNTVKWDQRLAYDIEYVKNLSFKLDLEIVLESASAVLFSKGVSVDPRALMKDLNEERGN